MELIYGIVPSYGHYDLRLVYGDKWFKEKYKATTCN